MTPAQQEALLAFAAMRCQQRLLAVALVQSLETSNVNEDALEVIVKAIADCDLAIVRFREKANEARSYSPPAKPFTLGKILHLDRDRR